MNEHRKAGLPAKKIVLIFLATGALTAGAWAVGANWWRSQTPKQILNGRAEWTRIMQGYQQEYLQVNGTIRVYEDSLMKQEKDKMSFSFIKEGDDYFSVLGPIQTIKKDSLLLQVNDDLKTIFASHIKGNENGEGVSVMGLEQLLKDTAAYRIEGDVITAGSNRILTVNSDYSPEIRSARFTYDTIHYRISTATIDWYRNNADPNDNTVYYMKVEYSYPSGKSATIANRLAGIMTVQKGKLIPANAYLSYQLQLAD